ncbi:MAG: SEC-C domain-containing protein [Chitinophagales bacterium]|nr:SEC-C domain-containing protein [Chitinophagales bacterium]
MKNSIFEHQLDEVIQNYPKLSKFPLGNIFILRGIVDIIGSDGKFWDSYEIEIHPHKDFPNKFPILFEVSKKIPRNPDWHINIDGSCCVAVLPEELIMCKQSLTVLSYIDKYVIPFFANQTYRKLTGNFANGEYSHGIAGILEFYEIIFQTKDIELMNMLSKWILNNPKPNRTNMCFCGSKKKFRHCHAQLYDKIAKIGTENVDIHLRILSLVKKY